MGISMNSYLKWAGSKRPILQRILATIDHYDPDVLIEPFCGALNVGANVECDIKIVNDINSDLMNLHALVKGNPYELIEVSKHYFDMGIESYKEIRDAFNAYDRMDIVCAAMFLYLNRHCFNGLCRYNKSGKFNVPVGDYKKAYFPEEEILDYHKKLANCLSFSNFDFQICFDMIVDNPEYQNRNTVVYCFDEESEILTKDGWKFVKDVTKTDECLSRDTNDNKLDWVGVQKTHSRYYDGEMYSYQGKSLDVLVTPDHNLLLHKRYNGNNVKISAAESMGRKFDFVCGGGEWDNSSSETIEVCGHIMNRKDFAYILGIFVTDGSINNQGSITINQTKTFVKEKIEYKLKSCGINYSKYKQRNGSSYYIPRKYLSFFEQFYDKNKRSIPREFLDSDKETLSELLQGIIDGDGDNATDRNHIRISLASKPLVDNISEIAIKLGKSSNYSIRQPKKSYLKEEDRYIQGNDVYYVVSINETKTRVKQKHNESLVPYSGNVYCVTLNKWHNVVMRRNGKMVWIGQCDPPYVPLTSDFNYSAEGFTIDDQKRLAQLAEECKHTVIISNHDTPVTRELYKNATKIMSFPVQRTISSNGGKREKVKELIAVYER